MAVFKGFGLKLRNLTISNRNYYKLDLVYFAMGKRGQVTIFVVIAVVTVALVGVSYLVVNNKNKGNEVPKTSEIAEFKIFVDGCLRETGENGLVSLGEKGGYFIITDDTKSIEGNIPYYVYDNKKLTPSEEKISQQLSAFITEELGFCILNFKDFKPDFEITYELKSVNTNISSDKVEITLDYPLSIRKGDNTYFLDEFKIKIPVRLGIIYQVSEEVVNEQLEHPESICLSCLYDLGRKNKVHIDMLDYGNSTIFKVIDDNSRLNNESYGWSFAVK